MSTVGAAFHWRRPAFVSKKTLAARFPPFCVLSRVPQRHLSNGAQTMWAVIVVMCLSSTPDAKCDATSAVMSSRIHGLYGDGVTESDGSTVSPRSCKSVMDQLASKAFAPPAGLKTKFWCVREDVA